jgi:fatty acid desaturase
MKNIQSTKAHLEYIKEVKILMPRQAFNREPKKILYIISYFAILILLYYSFQFTGNIILFFLLSFLITHCLSCIGFLSHELSHNSIIKNKKYKYPIEIISWGINLIPATIWDRTHNHTHHTQANTAKDPDRQFFKSEKTTGTKFYTKFFYPNKDSMKWNPIVSFHFIPYIFRNIVSSFYSDDSKPRVVPFKPKYSGKQKANISLELVIIAAMQIAIFNLVGRNFMAYIFAGPISYLFTSSVLMTYIFTNHFLNPVTEHSDPLLGTTTVEVPALFNKLHFNFSYHTEHHLFPSMNSKFYPALSKILKNKYPDRYNYLPLKDAWKKLWKNDDFVSIDEG